MKESRKDKLIQYLNEYEDGMVSWVKEYVEEFGVFVLNTEQMIEEEIIISKSFGFVKRLVEKDKIDLLRLDNRIALSEFNKVERVLMALSISDTPIEDLISYLK